MKFKNKKKIMIKNKKEIERDKGYDFIRFLAMMMILIHHFRCVCDNYHYKIITFVKQIIAYNSYDFGSVGVALFFILSGAVLIKINKNNFNLSEFYKKRLKRICIPQWIGFLVGFCCTYIVWGKRVINCDTLGFIISFLGLNYAGDSWVTIGIKTTWVIGEWFTAVIIFLYIIFPVLRFLFVRYRLRSTIGIAFIFLLNLNFQILTYKGGWFSLTNAVMCFWTGMLFEEYKACIGRKVLISAIVFCCALVLFNIKEIFGYAYIPCFIFSVFLFIILYNIKYSNIFTEYICKYNYEIYLVHHRAYIIFLPAFLNAKSNNLQIVLGFVILTSVVFLLAEALQKASNKTYQYLLNKS